MHDAVIVQGVSKQFSRYHASKPATLQETILQGFRRMKPVDQFWALRDVSFRIAPGRMVGLIGRNGSGKSTLLSLIGGIGCPDNGRIKVNGRIRALLDMGVGLHSDLTGRENVFVSGVISGLTRHEVRQRFDDIVAFSELELLIDNPLRTYSTGMRMRLGFAIAVHTSPEILLVDEVLSVGDLAFQRKCLERIAQFKSEGCTILFVSHNETQIKQLCDEIVYLRQGELVAHGEPEVLVGQYIADIRQETHQRTPEEYPVLLASSGVELKINKTRFGSLEMQILSVRLLNAAGFLIKELSSGEPLQIEIEYIASHPIPSPVFGIIISRQDDLICYDTTTASTGQNIPTIDGQGKITLHIERLDLNTGQYYVNVGIYEASVSYAYDYHWQVYPLFIHQVNSFENGILCAPHSWRLHKVKDHLLSTVDGDR